MLDTLRQGAFRFHNAYQTQRERWTVEGELRDFQQRGKICFGVAAHRHDDRFVHRLFAHATNLRIGEPEQGMPPVNNLQQRL